MVVKRMKFSKQLVVAHRGASGLVEFENTIESFSKALEVGADAFECDVRKTKDGQMIIVHNDNYDGHKIADLDYKSLCSLTLEKGFIMPTLEETLQWCKDKIFIDIELKEEGYEEEVVDLVKKYLTYDKFFIRSFNDNSLRLIKKIDSNIKTVLLLGEEFPKHVILTRISELFPLWRILKTKCDMVSPYYKLVILGYTWRLKLSGRPVLVWTVNEEELMKKMLFKKKVAAIITNYPDVALKVLEKK